MVFFLIWEDVRSIHQEGTLLEVGCVKAHRTKKEKKEMTLFEKFVTEDNEKADELAKDGECWMEERWRRSGPAQSSGEKRGGLPGLPYAVSVHWLVEEWHDCEAQTEAGRHVDRTVEAKEHRTEWCAATHRGMRCGRIKKMNM